LRWLTVGRGAEDAQVAGADPDPRELVGGADDLAVGLVVDGLAVALLGLDDAEVFEFRHQLVAGAGLLDHLVEGEMGAGGVDEDRPPHRAAAGPPLGGAAAEVDVAARRQLLADHAKRQELVALQAQDRAQALDIGLAVEAVTAGGAARVEQLLVLEVADLGDRDVVELALQDLADGADRQRLARAAGRLGNAGLLLGDRHHFSR
jgi:hypothetical protein